MQARCPDSLAFGVLHDDHKDHLHYHLMISANALGAAKRFRLSKTDFARIKAQIEELCLMQFPELQQDRVMQSENLQVKKKNEAALEKEAFQCDPTAV